MRFRSLNLPVLIGCLLLCVSCGNSGDDLTQHYANKKGDYPIITKHLDAEQEPLFTNRLIKQESLYLLQHAHNPVQWWSWGDDAFAAARKQDKPILLSIGYSTCHWCHVMARESFEDIEIANFINQNFIPIKVDREEHPDVDEVYLTAVQMLSGQAGWPLTAVLTPKGQPFFGGTYFTPKKFLGLLTKVNDTWTHRREAVVEQAERLETALKGINKSASNAKAINDDIIDEAVARIQRNFTNGEQGPGFPREPEMLFLLNHTLNTLSQQTLKSVSERLHELAAGGIHDQIGGGFHRYTVDSDWKIPHFEKMLYNQAQMGQVYLRAYLLNSDPTLRTTGEAVLNFILREMQASDGGFYAAMDAESEGNNGDKSEGAYYTWTYQELSALLNDEELSVAESALGVSQQGNFNGSNVLQNIIPRELDGGNGDQSTEKHYSNDQVTAILDKLSSARQLRKKPAVDTKIITAWNSMAISALLTGYHTLNNDKYRAAAVKAAERLWQNAFNENQGLARTLPNGKRRVAGTLEDYAYFANTLVDLHDLDGDKIWLSRATQIAKQMISRFHDKDTGGFLISSTKDQKSLLVALVTARDDAINSGNSMAAQALARLFRRTGNIEYRQATRDVLLAFSKQLFANPESLSGMLVAANLLNQGEAGQTLHVAKAKVKINSTIIEQSDTGRQLAITATIADGWHINANPVLENDLIATTLTPITSHCSSVADVNYPPGKQVSLGFQESPLSIYENKVTIKADIIDAHESRCQLIATTLKVQACSNEVCLQPEVLQLRTPLTQ